jgi:multiple RNA-binding domain-containing protein 1
LKKIRLPKKSTTGHGHRGFAFVEYLTKQEAKQAFESLSSTHFYGRHLVLEWAEDDSSIAALRMKAKRNIQALNEGETMMKRQRRVDLGDEAEEGDDVHML